MDSSGSPHRSPLLAGKIMVVTGGRNGIGQTICIEAAREGADIVLVTRAAPEMAQVAIAAVEAQGRRALALTADVTNPDSVERLFDSVMARFGRLDVLVNNAGGFAGGPLESISAQDWDKVFIANTRSVFLCSSQAFKHMSSAGGAIVNITGASAHRTFIRGGAYGPAKAAVLALSRQMALEWGAYGIRSNCVSPGPIREPGENWQQREPALAQQVERIPLRRAGSSREVARAVIYLASDDAAYTTGQDLIVDGGSVHTWYMSP